MLDGAWADGGTGTVKNERKYPQVYVRPAGTFSHYLRPLQRNPILESLGNDLPAKCKYRQSQYPFTGYGRSSPILMPASLPQTPVKIRSS